MARYQSYLGEFRSPTSTGSAAYTGIGFEPKALWIWSAHTAQDNPKFNHFNYWSFSLTDGTNQLAQTSISFDNVGTSDLSQGVVTDALIMAEATDGTTQHRVTFTSFDADG